MREGAGGGEAGKGVFFLLGSLVCLVVWVSVWGEGDRGVWGFIDGVGSSIW